MSATLDIRHVEQVMPLPSATTDRLMTRMGRASALVLVLLLAASRPGEAQQPLSELSLEELMNLDAGRVFGSGVYDPRTKSLDARAWLAEETGSR